MSNFNEIIRNPKYFPSDNSNVSFRQPYELSDGNFCKFRNSNTKDYRTFSPYDSQSEDLSKLVNTPFKNCDIEVTQQDKPIFKIAEDLYGNKFLLFKSDIESNITTKRKSVGELVVLDVNGDKLITIPEADLSKVINVSVFYTTVIITTDDKIWLGNTKTNNFFSIDYHTHSQIYYKDNLVYILYDNNIGVFGVDVFDGEDITTITKNQLTDNITSSSIHIKSNRIEIIYTDSQTKQKLVFSEYDFNTNLWTGFNTINFPYEVLGSHDNSQSWKVYYEGLTHPNFVGGLCIDFPQTTTNIQTTDDCESKEVINFVVDIDAYPPDPTTTGGNTPANEQEPTAS